MDSNANVAQSSDDDSEFALASSSSVCNINKWIMDFACTHHMSSNKDWFYDFKERKCVV